MKNVQPVRETFKTHSRAGEVSCRPARRHVETGVTLKVNPKVWAMAIGLADGDGLRIEVVSEDEVIVHNGRR